MAKENSWLDETFYRHLFDADPQVRDRSQRELDQKFAQLAEDGISRYEITRQMICGIINAQERRDTEAEAETSFATTNSQPNVGSTANQARAPRSPKNRGIASARANSAKAFFWGCVLMAAAIVYLWRGLPSLD